MYLQWVCSTSSHHLYFITQTLPDRKSPNLSTNIVNANIKMAWTAIIMRKIYEKLLSATTLWTYIQSLSFRGHLTQGGYRERWIRFYLGLDLFSAMLANHVHASCGAITPLFSPICLGLGISANSAQYWTSPSISICTNYTRHLIRFPAAWPWSL